MTDIGDIHARSTLSFPASLPQFQRLFPDNAACAAYLGDCALLDYSGASWIWWLRQAGALTFVSFITFFMVASILCRDAKAALGSSHAVTEAKIDPSRFLKAVQVFNAPINKKPTGLARGARSDHQTESHKSQHHRSDCQNLGEIGQVPCRFRRLSLKSVFFRTFIGLLSGFVFILLGWRQLYKERLIISATLVALGFLLFTGGLAWDFLYVLRFL